MVNDPQLIQVAAGIDFDSIAPFVFVILIVASQIIGALKKRGTKQEQEPDVDAIERARQIREEIRRKIEERRQEMEPGTTRPVDRPPRPAYNPTLPDAHNRRQTMQQSRQPVQQRPVAPTPPAQSLRRQPSLEEQLAEQRKQLEIARRTQKEAHAKAMRMLQESASERRVRENQSWSIGVSTNKLKNQLVSGLRDKNDLRKAILYREILDKPLGLR